MVALSLTNPNKDFRYVEETHMMLVALLCWRKLLQYLSTNDEEKIFCQVFHTNSDMKVHALHYAN